MEFSRVDHAGRCFGFNVLMLPKKTQSFIFIPEPARKTENKTN